MDYEKKYKEALEMARDYYKANLKLDNVDENLVLEDIFPELKESEDEKIRKEILDYIDKSTGCKRWVAWLEKQGDKDSQIKLPTFTFDDILALQCCMETVKKVQEDKDLYKKLNDLHGRVYDAYQLEKQGEKKVANNVRLKFKVGDYVVDNCGYVWRIEGIINQFYILEGIDGGESRPTIEWVNKTFHLWDITEDAKNGDVLVNGSNTFIFHFINDTRLMGYCHVNTNDGRFYDDIGKNECFCLIDAVVNPATKEQCDVLFAKMKESGYEWNAEKKELKKIEDEEYDGDDYGIDSLWHAKNILEKTLGKVDGYQTDDGILDHKCAISAVDRLYKQKPAEWSEDDEYNFAFIQEALLGLDGDDSYLEKCCKMAEWLNSIKDRVGNFGDGYKVGFSAAKYNQWKPSEEQMKALNSINVTGGISYAGQGQELINLFNDLKKLKG